MRVITQSERLLLRTWEPEDASDAFAIWGDPEVMRHVGNPIVDVAAARRTVERSSDAQRRHGVSLWAVVEKTSGDVIGACGFHFVAEGPELELAYHFKRSYWKRGFATEAACACVRYAADTLGATSIIAGVAIGNAPSRKVLENIGFHLVRLDRTGDFDEEWFSIELISTS